VEKEKAYSIEKLYADAPINISNPSNGTDDIGLAEVTLSICLEASDWYKFQAQPFYRELIQYLDKSTSTTSNT